MVTSRPRAHRNPPCAPSPGPRRRRPGHWLPGSLRGRDRDGGPAGPRLRRLSPASRAGAGSGRGRRRTRGGPCFRFLPAEEEARGPPPPAKTPSVRSHHRSPSPGRTPSPTPPQPPLFTEVTQGGGACVTPARASPLPVVAAPPSSQSAAPHGLLRAASAVASVGVEGRTHGGAFIWGQGPTSSRAKGCRRR